MKEEYDFTQGRRGPVIPSPGKTRITIYLDNDVLDAFRDMAEASGSGYQTLINKALREYLDKPGYIIDEMALRRVLREELERGGKDE
ncbi:MAG: BrnA antitoxin family protein [Anaerolineae bacterium]|nr:BrnA antitoxin family protein [Anaerolineae bacterium]